MQQHGHLMPQQQTTAPLLNQQHPAGIQQSPQEQYFSAFNFAVNNSRIFGRKLRGHFASRFGPAPVGATLGYGMKEHVVAAVLSGLLGHNVTLTHLSFQLSQKHGVSLRKPTTSGHPGNIQHQNPTPASLSTQNHALASSRTNPIDLTGDEPTGKPQEAVVRSPTLVPESPKEASESDCNPTLPPNYIPRKDQKNVRSFSTTWLNNKARRHFFDKIVVDAEGNKKTIEYVEFTTGENGDWTTKQMLVELYKEQQAEKDAQRQREIDQLVSKKLDGSVPEIEACRNCSRRRPLAIGRNSPTPEPKNPKKRARSDDADAAVEPAQKKRGRPPKNPEQWARSKTQKPSGQTPAPVAVAAPPAIQEPVWPALVGNELTIDPRLLNQPGSAPATSNDEVAEEILAEMWAAFEGGAEEEEEECLEEGGKGEGEKEKGAGEQPREDFSQFIDCESEESEEE